MYWRTYFILFYYFIKSQFITENPFILIPLNNKLPGFIPIKSIFYKTPYK